MARTPLLNTLHGLFRDARIARAYDWPLAKLRDSRAARLERDNARGVSRRAFLKGAGMLTAATAVPRFSFAAAQPTVVIVGAGIAGLNCALELPISALPAWSTKPRAASAAACSATPATGTPTRSPSGAAN